MGGLCLLLDFGFAVVICVLNWLLGLRISGLLGLRWVLVISVVLAVFWVFPGFRVWWCSIGLQLWLWFWRFVFALIVWFWVFVGVLGAGCAWGLAVDLGGTLIVLPWPVLWVVIICLFWAYGGLTGFDV